MKIFSIICLIISIISCSSNKKNDLHDIQVHNLKLVDSTNSKGLIYSFEINLINKSKTVFNFWMMTCSWQTNWTTDNESINFFHENCPGNFPKIFQIDPNDTLIINGKIIVENSLSVKKAKLGFYHIKPNEIESDDQFQLVLREKILRRESIIWSKEFTL